MATRETTIWDVTLMDVGDDLLPPRRVLCLSRVGEDVFVTIRNYTETNNSAVYEDEAPSITIHSPDLVWALAALGA